MIKKNKEFILYIIFGVLSTLVKLISYKLLTITLLDPNIAVELQVANILSWFITVIFVYFTNRKYVFCSTNKNKIKEFSMFLSARVFTLLLEMLIMYYGVTVLRYDDFLVQVISQIVVILTNYVFSKLVIFKK